MTKKPTKLHLPLDGAERHIARLIAQGGPVEIERTAYAITATTPTRRYYFSDGSASKALFSVVSSIKADIDKAVSEGRLWDEHAPADMIRYHYLPNELKLPRACWCVDITAAYPYTAMIHGLITDATFKKLMGLPKPDRLRALGMLATRKYYEAFDDGELQGAPEHVDSPYRVWYQDICALVGEVMTEAREACGPGFIMFWVDGIFCTDPEPAKSVLTAHGYKCTVERVEDIRLSDDGKYIHYRKGDGQPTYLCVPKRHQIDGRSLRRALQESQENELR